MSKTEITEHYVERWTESQEDQSKQYIPEKYQLGILTDYLERHKMEYVTEGRIFSSPIDILAARGETTIAIEMKSKNLGRGIEQAHRDASFVDFAFLAVWDHRVSDSLLDRVSDLPIGVMEVGEEVEVIAHPEKLPQQLYKKKNVLEMIHEHVRDDTSVQESE